jgi:NNP family nitrate/nitrite transporter-like MFS transporter
VTFWNFVAMAAGAGVVLLAAQQRSLPLYLVGFVALFVFSGVGNGSTYKMIPAIFTDRRLAGAVIGIAGAIGAFGGVLVNLAFRQSFLSTGSADAAYMTFIGFYALCVAVTWVVYRRPGSPVAGV